MKITMDEFKKIIQGLHQEALPFEYEAMGLYGAKDSKFDEHCYFDDFFKVYANEKIKELRQRLLEAENELDFYAKGGNSNTDIWIHERLGYFTGRRAKMYLEKFNPLGLREK